MKTIHVKRRCTFIDDRSPKYFVMNGKNMGKIFPLFDNQFNTDDKSVEIYVKDFFGVKSNSLQLNGEDNFHVEYRLNTAWLICTSLMLLITFIFVGIVGIPVVRSFVAEHLSWMAFLPVIWIVYMGVTFIFLRDKLYIITKK